MTMDWRIWAAFVATEVVMCLSPGPAVMMFLSQALRWGARASVLATAGILAANALYFLLSATGLGAMLAASYQVFFAVKWAGAAYLVFLGVKTIAGASARLNIGQATGETGLRMFGNAFAVQASNPKSLIFFTALLPQFIDARAPVAGQILILGLTSMAVEFMVLFSYGILAGRAMRFARQPRYAVWTNRIAGGVLLGAGAGMAALRRS